MDFSVLYRVLYSPRRVFEQWGDKARTEPFIIVGIFAVLLTITLYIGDGGFFNNSILWTLGLPLGLFLLLLRPIVETCFIYLLAYYNFITRKPKFYIVLNFFILCTIPLYIEIILIRSFASTLSHKYYTIAYCFINPIRYFLHTFKTLSPFLTGMLGTFSLSFFWTIFLWWMALTQLLKFKSRTIIPIVGSLVIVNMLIGGIIGFIPYIISKYQGVQ